MFPAMESIKIVTEAIRLLLAPMKLVRLALFFVLLAFVYYAGYREWGADLIVGWLENPVFHEMLAEIWNSITGWISDQELG